MKASLGVAGTNQSRPKDRTFSPGPQQEGCLDHRVSLRAPDLELDCQVRCQLVFTAGECVCTCVPMGTCVSAYVCGGGESWDKLLFEDTSLNLRLYFGFGMGMCRENS